MKSSKNSLLMSALTALALMVLGTANTVQAAVPKAEFKPAPILKGEGVLMGGKAGPTLALMDLRRSASAKLKKERVVMDFGGGNLKPANGLVGFFHAELQKKPSRLILELPQTYGSSLSEAQIQSRFKDSLYVKKAMVQFDRNLQSMTMVLELKSPMQVKVSPIRSRKGPGKLVVDIKPL